MYKECLSGQVVIVVVRHVSSACRQRRERRGRDIRASSIVTSSAFEPPWETSWHNQGTGVDKGSKHRPTHSAGVFQGMKKGDGMKERNTGKEGIK
jgi:hypothetical protein